MILYNITFNIEPEIQRSWLDWMNVTYLPYVLATEMFYDAKMYRLLNEAENQGLTYSVQFFARTLDQANTYLDNYAKKIVDKHNEAFRHRHVSFMTILESVD